MSTLTILDAEFEGVTDHRDDRLRALTRAKEIWQLAPLASKAERLVWAHELHRFELFSNNQLAKICRVSVPTVCRHMQKNAIGGRFAPEALTSVIYLRKIVIAQEVIPAAVVRTAVKAGMSVSTIARLTGISSTTLYTKTK